MRFFLENERKKQYIERGQKAQKRGEATAAARATRHSCAAPSAATADCELVRHDPRKMLPCSKPFSKKPVQMDHRGVPQAFHATHTTPSRILHTTKRLETNERPRNLTSRQRTGPRHSLHSVRSQHTNAAARKTRPPPMSSWSTNQRAAHRFKAILLEKRRSETSPPLPPLLSTKLPDDEAAIFAALPESAFDARLLELSGRGPVRRLTL